MVVNIFHPRIVRFTEKSPRSLGNNRKLCNTTVLPHPKVFPSDESCHLGVIALNKDRSTRMNIYQGSTTIVFSKVSEDEMSHIRVHTTGCFEDKRD